ncbi:MAG: glycoside hydrolase family 3 N-terminal domain-containing protein [Bacteroidota bacterium]
MQIRIIQSLFFICLTGGTSLSVYAQEEVIQDSVSTGYSLADFFTEDSLLDATIESYFTQLTDKQRVGQMMMNAAGRLGWPTPTINELVKEGELGGVLLLNGSREGFKEMATDFQNLSLTNGHLPLVFSADAEPSLVNSKIQGTARVSKTSGISSQEESRAVARAISEELEYIGIQYNLAPVLDLSPDNAAIGNRSFGHQPDSVVALAGAFVEESQSRNIATSIKHFPGHGLVKGDTHERLVYIDSIMEEVEVYKPLIKNGAVSVMIGHIAVKNHPQYDTEGWPASCSRKIITDLLKYELGFKGIVITDAMNMGALSVFPNPKLASVKAGADIILMPGSPKDTRQLIQDVLTEMGDDEEFQQQVYDSVRKILRLKICLGVLAV